MGKFCEGFEISQNAEDLIANGTVLARAEIHSRRVYLHDDKTGEFNTEIKSNLRHRAVNCQLLTATSMECSIDYTTKTEEEESKNQQEVLLKKTLKTPNSGVSCSSPGNGMRSRLDSAIQTSGIATDSSERLKESEKSTTTSQSNSPDEGSSKCSKNQ